MAALRSASSNMAAARCSSTAVYLSNNPKTTGPPHTLANVASLSGGWFTLGHSVAESEQLRNFSKLRCRAPLKQPGAVLILHSSESSARSYVW